MTIAVKQAVPIAIIVNELLTNAFKYAFDDDTHGLVKVTLKKKGDNISICIKDNGIGIPQEYVSGTREGLGITLIRVLVEQLEGSLSIDNVNGTKYEIVFK